MLSPAVAPKSAADEGTAILLFIWPENLPGGHWGGCVLPGAILQCFVSVSVLSFSNALNCVPVPVQLESGTEETFNPNGAL